MKWFTNLSISTQEFIICMAIVMLPIIFGFPVIAIEIYTESQTSQTAIKAGLVQDEKGHWVKPTTSLEK